MRCGGHIATFTSHHEPRIQLTPSTRLPHHTHTHPTPPSHLPAPHHQADQRDKERRQKEKQEAHLYCHVRIATDQDIAQQV